MEAETDQAKRRRMLQEYKLKKQTSKIPMPITTATSLTKPSTRLNSKRNDTSVLKTSSKTNIPSAVKSVKKQADATKTQKLKVIELTTPSFSQEILFMRPNLSLVAIKANSQLSSVIK
jgi:Cu2+-containing amine oxidase